MRRSWSPALGRGGLFAGSLALPGPSEREVVVPPVAASACALVGMGHAWFALLAVGARLLTRSAGSRRGLGEAAGRRGGRRVAEDGARRPVGGWGGLGRGRRVPRERGLRFAGGSE